MALVTKIAEHRKPEGDRPVAGEEFDPVGVSDGRLRLRNIISGKIEIARRSVSENLARLIAVHVETGGLRNGTILRDGIETLVRATDDLVNEILGEFGSLPWPPDLIQGVREGVVGFIEFLDGELDRFAHRVELEIECKSGPHGIASPARRIWSESRNKLIDEFEHRIENSREGEECARDVAQVAGDETRLGAATSQDILPVPGFALEAEVSKSEPDVSMKNLALGGQPVDRVRFGPKPKSISAEETAPKATDDWCAAWADLIVQICNGGVRPRKQSEWREAFEEVCSRQRIEPDPAVLDEWSNLVWRKLITSRFVLSEVRKDIRHEAELAAGREDYLPVFDCAGPASADFSATLGCRSIGGTSVSWLTSERFGAAEMSMGAAGEPSNQPGPIPDRVHDLSTDLGLAVPVAQIDY